MICAACFKRLLSVTANWRRIEKTHLVAIGKIRFSHLLQRAQATRATAAPLDQS